MEVSNGLEPRDVMYHVLDPQAAPVLGVLQGSDGYNRRRRHGRAASISIQVFWYKPLVIGRAVQPWDGWGHIRLPSLVSSLV